MPELPEVESLARFLRKRTAGLFVTRAEPIAISALKTFDPAVSSLCGLEVTGVARHGKFLDIDCSGLHLVMHLARAGWLRWREQLSTTMVRPGRGPMAFRCGFDDGAGFDLTEAGTTKKLAVYVVRDVADVPGVARLGIDVFDPEFTTERLGELLAGRRTQIKGALTEQSLLAGVGNAYSDEALHAAKLSPFALAANLTPEQVAALHDALVSVMAEAVIRAEGLALTELKAEKKSGLAVHGKTGLPCPVCGDTVREVSFADKSLQYCPTCQTGGKPLADRRMSRLLK